MTLGSTMPRRLVYLGDAHPRVWLLLPSFVVLAAAGELGPGGSDVLETVASAEPLDPADAVAGFTRLLLWVAVGGVSMWAVRLVGHIVIGLGSRRPQMVGSATLMSPGKNGHGSFSVARIEETRRRGPPGMH